MGLPPPLSPGAMRARGLGEIPDATPEESDTCGMPIPNRTPMPIVKAVAP